MAKAVFLDRDGLINEEIWDYVRSPKDFRLIPRAACAIKRLNEVGILVVVVSNQGGIAKGHYDEDTLKSINEVMIKELSMCGARLDGIYYCPHHPEGKGLYGIDCECRKPNPGMLIKAANDLCLNLPECWMVGDKISDIEAGSRVGCKTILVLTGYGKKMLMERERWPLKPDLIRDDLYDAASTIIDNPKII